MTTCGSLRVDRSRCDGAGFCAVIAPGHFLVDVDGLVSLQLVDVDEDDLADVEEAVEVCPTGSIVFEGPTGS